MIEVVREGSFWSVYRDGVSMLYSNPSRGAAVAWAKRKARNGERVKVSKRDSFAFDEGAFEL